MTRLEPLPIAKRGGPSSGRSDTDEPSISILRLALALGSATALVLVIPIVLLASIADSGRSGAWAITFVVMVVCGLQISWLIWLGEKAFFQFFFSLFCFIFIGLAPTVQLRSGDMPSTTPGTDPAMDVPAALLAGVGIGAAWLGMFVAAKRATAVCSARKLVDLPRLRTLTTLAIIGSGLYAVILGLDAFFLSRDQFYIARAAAWPDPSTAALVQALATLPALIAAHAWLQTREVRGSQRYLFRSLFLSAIPLFLVNPISSARYLFGTVWGSFLGPLGAYRSKNRTALTFVVIVIGFLFLFPVADYFRRVGSITTRSSFFGEYRGNGDYDAFAQLSNAVAMTSVDGIVWGRQALGVIVFWVPRSLWADKPIDTGVLLAQFRGYPFRNLSAPLWAELLVSFGVVGVVIGLFALGYLLARLDSRSRQFGPGTVSGITAAVLPFYTIILLRGSLLQATGWLIVMCLCLWFIRGRASIDRDVGERSLLR